MDGVQELAGSIECQEGRVFHLEELKVFPMHAVAKTVHVEAVAARVALPRCSCADINDQVAAIFHFSGLLRMAQNLINRSFKNHNCIL
ncbi:hypothetical protein AGR7C_Lc100078 [Agrobacterium deltaense Zutra 3/1]|uniref:Uncharacterized protein n=1 Tax=Agrobacterium deltaense Zutra 3/1 TaxID=1183427 RepID=A0A1S7QRC6_9HYPH|nr:hypothetical protein AGR7C_Lc100078 [Agrobacterium deltaense Zutra 3/1]